MAISIFVLDSKGTRHQRSGAEAEKAREQTLNMDPLRGPSPVVDRLMREDTAEKGMSPAGPYPSAEEHRQADTSVRVIFGQ